MASEAFTAMVKDIDAGEVKNSNPKRVQAKTFPRQEFLFFSQLSLIFIVVLASILNISMGNGKQEVWMILLSTGIGALLPNPKLRKCKNIKTLQSDIIRLPISTP